MTFSLQDLGWSSFFDRQLGDPPDTGGSLARVAEIHRDRLTGLTPEGPRTLFATGGQSTGDFAVGDWVHADDAGRIVQLFDRQTLLSRRAAGTDARVQLIAANVDTLFVTSSCNADFNVARQERYLALARDAGCFPVIVLTKADLAEDPRDYERRAQAVAAHVPVLAINALDENDLTRVSDWCRAGQTAALLGSSGVGKSTVMNGLTGAHIATRTIREDDAKGRHTTTTRALRQMQNGGWLIDTPGMRALRLADAAEGIESLFHDIFELASECRFSDCTHGSEPGCAVQAAMAEGRLDPDRLARWQKLARENARNSETLAEARARDKSFGKMVRQVMRDKDDLKRR